MAKRRRHSGLRLTPLGYLVTGIIVLVAIVGVYFAIWSARENREANPQGNAQATATTTAPTQTPSLAPITTPTIAPLDFNSPPPLSLSPAGASNSPDAATSAVSSSPSAPPAVKTPTSSQKRHAVEGKLTTDGVVLREGPTRSFDVIKTYNAGTELEIYEADGDYYYVQVTDEKVYGYMAIKFIEKDGLLSGETASPTPKAPDGAVNGTVTASVVALRKMPTTEGNTPIGEVSRGDAVFIYFKVDDFYYLQVVKTGVKCYAKASFFDADGSVPTGTPVP